MTATAAAVPLVALNLFAASVWVGGMVAIFVVARIASRTLDPAARVAFFRALGRAYGVVGCVALLLAIASGAALLAERPWDGLATAAAILAAALVLATAVGMAQARAMTRLRRRALAAGAGEGLERQVSRGAALAAALRGSIALLTLALVLVGSALIA